MKITYTVTCLVLATLSLVACKKSPEAGAACDTEGSAVCKNDKTMMNCRSGKWEALACKGSNGCQKIGSLLKCDMSIGVEGEPCGGGEGYTCTGDKKTQLKCVDTKWKAEASCGGPDGCESTGVFAKCDSTVAKVGDLCSKEGSPACAADGKSILLCKSKKYAEGKNCPDGTRCNGGSIMIRCE